MPREATTILIVDDEPLLRLYAEDFLSDAGFETISVSSADEAIAVLERRDDIRVILTDVQMPGSMDGVRLAAAVRDRWPPVAIIVVSGQLRSPPQLPQNSRFFAKPFVAQDVVNAVREMIG